MKIIVETTGQAEFEVDDKQMRARLEEAARTWNTDEISLWTDTWRSDVDTTDEVTILADDGRTLWSGELI